jgi:glycosyltransferase involved in cell wall biosynthesis
MRLSIITASYNRPKELSTVALPSLINQTDCNFEWVIVNDGANFHTKEIIKQLQTSFPVTYLEIEHSATGFGLCHARNAGLNAATNELVSYLDDDNSLQPEFVAATRAFFQDNSQVKYGMVVQNRRRDVVKDGITTRIGKSFLSPSCICGLDKLIVQDEIFDSNGFTHYQENSCRWNPNYKIFADYEFLLQSASRFGRKTFKLNPQVLVNYIQSSEGIIGRSTYLDWGSELKEIVRQESTYQLKLYEINRLTQLADKFSNQDKQNANAFI